MTARLSPDEEIIFRDYPLILWLTGIATLFLAGLIIDELSVRIIFAGIGISALAFASVLTVTVVRGRGTLNLHYRSPARNCTKSYPLRDISFVKVKKDTDEGNYRVELFLWSGEIVPLRSAYTAIRRGKERQARQLRSVLGM